MTDNVVPQRDLIRAKRDKGLCSGCRMTEAHCITAIRDGATKCCPDCEHRESVLAAVLPGHDLALILSLADKIEWNRRAILDDSNGAITAVVATLRLTADEIGGSDD